MIIKLVIDIFLASKTSLRVYKTLLGLTKIKISYRKAIKVIKVN